MRNWDACRAQRRLFRVPEVRPGGGPGRPSARPVIWRMAAIARAGGRSWPWLRCAESQQFDTHPATGRSPPTAAEGNKRDPRRRGPP